MNCALQNPSHVICPSLNLRERSDVKECIVHSWRVQKLLNMVLASVHPLLYASAAEAKAANELQLTKADPYVASLWESVFHGIAVISNGTTQHHRDTKVELPWYNILVSIGTVENLFLELPELKTRLSYSLWTVVALAGYAISHGVQRWEEGKERACWAFFLRAALFERHEISMPEWPTTSSWLIPQ